MGCGFLVHEMTSAITALPKESKPLLRLIYREQIWQCLGLLMLILWVDGALHN